MIAPGSKIPLDAYRGASLEYRYDFVGLGLQYEGYNGSAVTKWGERVVNPVYRHEMIGAYVVLGM